MLVFLFLFALLFFVRTLLLLFSKPIHFSLNFTKVKFFEISVLTFLLYKSFHELGFKVLLIDRVFGIVSIQTLAPVLGKFLLELGEAA